MLFWHQPVWEQFLRMGENIPHAILLYGSAGIGKSLFAEHLAKSLLCENRLPGGHACDQCVSCNWFDQKTHPDYHRILPAALDTAKKSDDNVDPADAKEERTPARSGKMPSKWIGINQIRDLRETIGLSTSRGGYRVICLWPAEALTTESSNALLKMLEEPSFRTVFILVTDHMNGLLPTILSRCRKFAMPSPDFSSALNWLKDQGIADAHIWLAEEGGAPIKALEMAKNNNRDEMDAFLTALMSPDIETALKTAEKLRKSSANDILSWIQKWLYDLLSLRMTGRLRYFLRWQQYLEKQALQVNLDELLRMIKKTAERKQVSEHPLVLRLLMEDILIDYARLFA